MSGTTAWLTLLTLSLVVYGIVGGTGLGVGSLSLFGTTAADRRSCLRTARRAGWGGDLWLVAALAILMIAFPNGWGVIRQAGAPLFPVVLTVAAVRWILLALFAGREDPPPEAAVAVGIGSVLLIFLLALLWGNIIIGLPIDDDRIYRGSVATLFRPFPIYVGLVAIVLGVLRGGSWYAIRRWEPLAERVYRALPPLWIAALFAVAGLTGWTLAAVGHPESFGRLLFWIPQAMVVIGLALLSVSYDQGKHTLYLTSTYLLLGGEVLLYLGILYPVSVPATLGTGAGALTWVAAAAPGPFSVTRFAVALAVAVFLALLTQKAVRQSNRPE